MAAGVAWLLVRAGGLVTRDRGGVREDPVMVQRTVVLLSDDLDGGPAAETVSFALDGVGYALDLSAGNAAALREVFAPYALAGRRIRVAKSGPVVIRMMPRPPGATAPARPAALRNRADREQLAAIRAWARGRGLAVSDRGRIAAHIIEAYHHPDSAPGGATAPTVVEASSWSSA